MHSTRLHLNRSYRNPLIRIFSFFLRYPKIFIIFWLFMLLIFMFILTKNDFKQLSTSSSKLINDHDHSNIDKLSQSMKRCAPLSQSARLTYQTFVKRLVETFNRLHIVHFLCYETLWNVLKRKSGDEHLILRVRDGCITICLLNNDDGHQNQTLMEHEFKRNGITVNYDYNHGIYEFKPKSKLFSTIIDNDNMKNETFPLHLFPDIFTIHARIYLYQYDQSINMYSRIGWKNSIFNTNDCEMKHCFPSELVHKRPLPQIELINSLNINVPHHGIELLKYQYLNNWWNMTNEIDECDSWII
ncbi:hypothetical protein BLOT_011111 [Blomia tropicalis]|nr:hypothetical protein BLOT_011111 [Blomia tropicalis]